MVKAQGNSTSLSLGIAWLSVASCSPSLAKLPPSSYAQPEDSPCFWGKHWSPKVMTLATRLWSLGMTPGTSGGYRRLGG